MTAFTGAQAPTWQIHKPAVTSEHGLVAAQKAALGLA